MIKKNTRVKLSQLENGKEYRVNNPYFFNAVFFKVDGRLHYRLDNGQVHKTTYNMFPGLNNCTFSEFIDEEEIDAILLNQEPTFLFHDDYMDHKISAYEYGHPNGMGLHEYLGMTREKFKQYLYSRMDRE